MSISILKTVGVAAAVVSAVMISAGCGGKGGGDNTPKSNSAVTDTGNTVETVADNPPPPPDTTFTDSRDGKVYKIAKIGAQTWMAENLKFQTIWDGGNAYGSYCSENKEAICQKEGRLYIWQAAVKACPAGWHLPTDADWAALKQAISGNPGVDFGSPAGTNGGWWSATNGKFSKRNKDFGNIPVDTDDEGGDADLYSVRCVQD